MAKRTLTTQELDAQTAVELPDRDMMLVTVVIGRIDVIDDVTITVRDVNLALQICAQLVATGNLTCEIGGQS